MKCSGKATNEKLHKKRNVATSSIQMINARWRLFGHILRLNERTSSAEAMVSYSDDRKMHFGISGTFCTIATVGSDKV